MDNWILWDGRKIREHRKRLGLTQERLAQESGLALRTVVRLEHGANKLGGTVYALRRIADAFDRAEAQEVR